MMVFPLTRRRMALLIVLTVHSATPQTLHFDVASIRVHAAQSPGGGMRTTPDGIAYAGVTLYECIKEAYGVLDFQVGGYQGPLDEVVTSDRYDIAAKASSPLSPDARREMLRSLLAERFGLRVHREQKETAVYELFVQGKSAALRPATTSEGPGRRIIESGMSFRHATMLDLAEFLSGLEAVNLPVLEHTSLDGRFDFDLKMSDSQVAPGSSQEHALYTWGSIFSDIRQLGLRLNRTRGAVEMVMVDAAHKASAN